MKNKILLISIAVIILAVAGFFIFFRRLLMRPQICHLASLLVSILFLNMELG